VPELQKHQAQAARSQLPDRERQERLQKGHDTLNAGGSIGLRTPPTQALLELVDELGQPANPFLEIG
jgi:hypothetical protein